MNKVAKKEIDTNASINMLKKYKEKYPKQNLAKKRNIFYYTISKSYKLYTKLQICQLNYVN